MVNLSNTLLIALCAAIASADSSCGDGQQQIINGIAPNQVTVCCPGVMKTKSTGAYCCVGGTNSGCGQVTCMSDTSSCKALINVQDSNYAKEVEDAAGVKPRRPGHPDDSDAISSGSGSGSSSSSASVTVSNSDNPTSTISNPAVKTDNGAGNSHPVLGLVAGIAAVPALLYSL
ncbi:hypothetical protein GGI43DRAFT_221721 [Trichoderma evansii]